jgi:hypothetical protein
VIPRRRLLLPLLSILVSELIACARMHECTRACAQMCAHGESSFNTKVAKLGKLGRRPRRTAVGAARCSSTFLERDSRFCHHAPRLRSIAALARLRGKGGGRRGEGAERRGPAQVKRTTAAHGMLRCAPVLSPSQATPSSPSHKVYAWQRQVRRRPRLAVSCGTLP